MGLFGKLFNKDRAAGPADFEASADHSDCVVVVVTNIADFATVELAAEPGFEVAAGEPAIKLLRNCWAYTIS